jgi:hypothetical protein
MNKQFGKDFGQLADIRHIKSLTLENCVTGKKVSIDNVPGKQASVKILYAIAKDNMFRITVKEAETGIKLYGDYTQEELNSPGSHPNIRLLLDILTSKDEWLVSFN